MPRTLDIAEVLSSRDIAVPRPDAKGEVMISCPLHNDKKPSCSVNLTKHTFYCFSCEASGGAAKLRDLLGANVKASGAPEKKVPPPPPKPRPKQIPMTDDFRRVEHYQLGKPNKHWVYWWRGKPYMAFCRWATADGKETRPLIKTEQGYRWWSPDTRILYGTEKLTPEKKPIFFCEGEKAADACQKIIGDVGVAMTWHGGVNGVAHTDKKQFEAATKGRNVILWADYDDAGHRAMAQVAALVAESAADVYRVVLPEKSGKPKGWDAADALDEGMTYDKLKQLIPRPKKGGDDDDGKGGYMKADPRAPLPMGYDNDNRYWFFHRARALLIPVNGTEAQIKGMLGILAPRQFWLDYFGKPAGKDGIVKDYNKDEAADAMLTECTARGHFTDKRLRGRGVSMERGGRVVANMGDRLFVRNGRRFDERDISEQGDLHNIYEVGERIDGSLIRPCTNLQVGNFEDALARALNWENGESGILLIGWLATAIICGAMRRRPHIWISGSSGSGKGWLMDEVIKPMLRGFSLDLASKTTEAGIRGKLKRQCLPVIINEAEMENVTVRTIMEGILELATQAYDPESGLITKGTKDGGSRDHIIRSSFCFLSINYGLTKAAEKNRFIHLRIRRGEKTEADFRAGAKKVTMMTRDKDFVAGFRALAITKAHEIVEAAEIAAQIISDRNNDRRTGDTVGAIIGAYSVMSGVSIEDILDQNIILESGIFERGDADDTMILRVLFGRLVLRDKYGETNLWYALRLLHLKQTDGDRTTDWARNQLANYGIRLADRKLENGDVVEEVLIGHNPNVDSKIMFSEQWGKAWHNTLQQSTKVRCGNKKPKPGERRPRIGGKQVRKWAAIDYTDLRAIMKDFDDD